MLTNGIDKRTGSEKPIGATNRKGMIMRVILDVGVGEYDEEEDGQLCLDQASNDLRFTLVRESGDSIFHVDKEELLRALKIFE